MDSISSPISSFVQSPFDPGSILPLFLLWKIYTYISYFTVVSSCICYPEINLNFQSLGAFHFFVRQNPSLAWSSGYTADQISPDLWLCLSMAEGTSTSYHGRDFTWAWALSSGLHACHTRHQESCLHSPDHCLFNVHRPGNISFHLPFKSAFLLTSKKLYSLFLFLHKTQLLVFPVSPCFWLCKSL